MFKHTFSIQTIKAYLARPSEGPRINFDQLGIFLRATKISITWRLVRNRPPSDCSYLGRDPNRPTGFK